MRHAPRLDANHGDVVAALLGAGCSVQSLASVGAGCPDLLVWSPFAKCLVLMEVKNPERHSGQRSDEAQRKFRKVWKGDVAVVETVEQALSATGLAAAGERGHCTRCGEKCEVCL